MIYKIPIYCAFIVLAPMVFPILLTVRFEAEWGCTIFCTLYILHLVGKNPLYHITSRSGRSLVGFLRPVITLGADWHRLSVGHCEGLNQIELMYIFIFMLDDFVEWKDCGGKREVSKDEAKKRRGVCMWTLVNDHSC
jgi:hypothetical protein